MFGSTTSQPASGCSPNKMFGSTTSQPASGCSPNKSTTIIKTIMNFHNGEAYIGNFSFKDGKLEFDGEIGESAKILFNQFREYVDRYVKDELMRQALDSYSK